MHIDWSLLANIGEFLGGVGVLLSFLYVAIQLRERNRSRSSDTFARTVDRMASMQEMLAQDAQMCRLFNEALTDPMGLSMTDRVRFTWIMTELFGALEFMYLQSRQGGIPTPVWERWHHTMGWWLTFPGVRLWWRSKPAPFSAAFTGLVRECIEDRARFVAPDEWWGFLYPETDRGSTVGGVA